MSAMSRFGPNVARSFLMQQHRLMASTSTVSDPIQKLFLDKIREFKNTSKGLDEKHTKALQDETARLKRVYNIEENKLTSLDYKFSQDHDVSLHDIDTSREMRRQIESGEYQKQLAVQPKPVSELLATTPERFDGDEFHLPRMNKPDYIYVHQNIGVPEPPKMGNVEPDYNFVGDKMTPERLEQEFNVAFGKDMVTVDDDKAPGRDVVNFPRIPIPDDTPATRHHIIPESWFQFLYPKTGVTGPYLFGTGFLAFLLSKEWIVMEHEFGTAMSMTIIITYGVIKYGPKAREFFYNKTKKRCDDWDKWQQGHIECLSQMRDHYSKELSKAKLIDELYDARRQDVEVQLECEHRNRLHTVYEDTRRRLNYLVALANSQRQIHQDHMVNWVLSNVNSSIGPKQETEVLDSCIANLKQLANKNANLI